jgi:hypothetical protein
VVFHGRKYFPPTVRLYRCVLRLKKKFWKGLIWYFSALFNTTVPAALFNYGKPRTFVFKATLFTMVTVVTKWVKLWDPLLHKYGFNWHTRMVWFLWLPVLTLHDPAFTDVSFASTSEVRTSVVSEWLKIRD